MNISWDVVWKYVKFLLPLFRPSIAKALSVPLMLAGIGILTPPWWLDMLVKLLRNQMGLPQDDGQTSTPMYTTGWALIGLSIVIYLIDVWRQVKSMNQDNEKKLQEIVKDYPEQTSNLTIEKFKSVGFIAPHLQDEKIDKLINEITLLRFFSTFPKEEKSSNLAESIIDGELSGGTPQAKARALALLARFLSVGEGVSLAKEWLSNSKRLCQTEESVIAQAFIDATGSNNIEAASGLLKVNSPSHYSAYFMIKRVVKGSNAALRWFEIAELSVQELDGDGKIALLSALLSERQWEKALDVAEAIDYESLSKFPALAQFTACTFLINAIKVIELRESVLINIPFAADRFPLADDTASIALRNRAVELFKICSDRAGHLGAEDVSSLADRYALWLELRNSETHERAMALLQSYFIKYSQKTLEYLPLAFVFGIDIDSESIENEVNRQSALSHDNDPILSLARFVLAHTKKSFPAMLKYIANHRPQIEKTVHPTAVGMFEIEALARSGLVDDAELLLQKIEASGATQDEVRSLKNIIESAKGEDPIALATSQYQQTKTTNDLSHLVDLLERENLGDKYYSYCRELFDRTGQESDAIRVCNAASSLGKFSEIHQFLSDRMEIVIRSEGLQAHWAWCLFRKGDINGARAQIALLKQSSSQQSNLRTLEINLSIFSGDWESLSFFIEGSWNRREELKAKELLQAAQLAKAVSPGRTRQILAFCTGKYSDDPQVLASSYFTATTMGWEDNQQTSEWLNKAMVLSNDDGPLHRASLEDLKEMMPENRDKNEKVYKAYFDGSAPIITVAELLNRTVSDFYLIQQTSVKVLWENG